MFTELAILFLTPFTHSFKQLVPTLVAMCPWLLEIPARLRPAKGSSQRESYKPFRQLCSPLTSVTEYTGGRATRSQLMIGRSGTRRDLILEWRVRS